MEYNNKSDQKHYYIALNNQLLYINILIHIYNFYYFQNTYYRRIFVL